MTRKKIRFLFTMSLVELAGLWGCILFSYVRRGSAPLAAGLLGLVLMVCSFTGSVYGMFEMKAFRENHERYGIVGTWLHVLVFLILAALYVIGVIFS